MDASEVVCHKIVGGVKPFSDLPSQGSFCIASQILLGRLPGTSAMLEQTPGLWSIVKNCWKVNPSERPTASQFYTEVSALVSIPVIPFKMSADHDS